MAARGNFICNSSSAGHIPACGLFVQCTYPRPSEATWPEGPGQWSQTQCVFRIKARSKFSVCSLIFVFY